MSTITELTELTTSEDSDILLIRDSLLDEDKHITKQNLLKEVVASIDSTETQIESNEQRLDAIETTISEKVEYTLLPNFVPLELNSIIQANQTNPLPSAADYPANTVLKVTVPDKFKGIITTHLPTGGDTTSGLSGDGFIINWSRGGTVSFISNGISEWRY